MPALETEENFIRLTLAMGSEDTQRFGGMGQMEE